MRDLLNLHTSPVVQSDTTELNPPAVGLVILAEGTLKILNTAGETVTIVFPAAADAGGSYPFILWGGVVKIFDNDTTLTNAEMLAIKN